MLEGRKAFEIFPWRQRTLCRNAFLILRLLSWGRWWYDGGHCTLLKSVVPVPRAHRSLLLRWVEFRDAALRPLVLKPCQLPLPQESLVEAVQGRPRPTPRVTARGQLTTPLPGDVSLLLGGLLVGDVVEVPDLGRVEPLKWPPLGSLPMRGHPMDSQALNSLAHLGHLRPDNERDRQS